MTKVSVKAKPKASKAKSPKASTASKSKNSVKKPAVKAQAKVKAQPKNQSKSNGKSAVSALKSAANKLIEKASETLSKVTAPEKTSAPVAPQKNKGTEKAKARESAMIRAKKEALETVATEAAENKKRGRKAKIEDIGPEESLSKLGKKWASLYKKSEESKTPTYNMRGVFEEKTPIQHKVLGWGYILSNKNDRLEVLFKDGIRFLISNYKA